MNNIVDIKTFRFILVGVVNTVVGTAIMFCLYNVFGCSYWISSAANYVLASILSYVLNKKFTFGYRGGTIVSGIKFVANIAVCYFISYGIAKPVAGNLLAESDLSLRENVAMAAGMCIFTILNYIGQRFFVFKDEDMKNKSDYSNKEYRKWLESDCVGYEDKQFLNKMTEEEIHEAFCRHVEFGTSGMRGKVGMGPNRINKYTIRLAARGVAEYMGKGAQVAVAYDTRNDSKFFAEETARVLAAAGVKAWLFEREAPVPLLSFAVRRLGLDGGIVITASHNTKEYNGFKTYNRLGIQMNPEATGRIFTIMKNVRDYLCIEVSGQEDANITYIGKEIGNQFTEMLVGQSLFKDRQAKSELRILYTPLYGSGRDYVKSALEKDGFSGLDMVREQSVFDGTFPGIRKPNPEDTSVFEVAEEMARSSKADIIIATDPDCDRLGVGVSTEKGIEYLNGNEIGALLIDFISKMKSLRGNVLVTTIVTGDLGADIAERRGAKVRRTLTGSKFICEEMEKIPDGRFLMGYEESYGYVTAEHVRDKDGISAAMFICEMAAYYKKRGLTLIDVLKAIYEEFGFYLSFQDSFDFEGQAGAEKIESIMETFRRNSKAVFSGFMQSYDSNMRNIEIIDYMKGIEELPTSNVLKFVFENGSWIAVRPSGTEPKIKFYYCVKAESRSLAENLLEKMRSDVKKAVTGF